MPTLRASPQTGLQTQGIRHKASGRRQKAYGSFRQGKRRIYRKNRSTYLQTEGGGGGAEEGRAGSYICVVKAVYKVVKGVYICRQKAQ